MWNLNKQVSNILNVFCKWPVLITSLLTSSYKCTSPKTNSQKWYLKSISLSIQFLLQNGCESGLRSFPRRLVNKDSCFSHQTENSSWTRNIKAQHDFSSCCYVIVFLGWSDMMFFDALIPTPVLCQEWKNSSFNQYVVIFFAWMSIESHFAGVYISNWGLYLVALGKHDDMLAHIMHW